MDTTTKFYLKISKLLGRGVKFSLILSKLFIGPEIKLNPWKY